MRLRYGSRSRVMPDSRESTRLCGRPERRRTMFHGICRCPCRRCAGPLVASMHAMSCISNVARQARQGRTEIHHRRCARTFEMHICTYGPMTSPSAIQTRCEQSTTAPLPSRAQLTSYVDSPPSPTAETGRGKVCGPWLTEPADQRPPTASTALHRSEALP